MKELKWLEEYFNEQDLPKLYALKRNYEKELRMIELTIKKKEMEETKADNYIVREKER